MIRRRERQWLLEIVEALPEEQRARIDCVRFFIRNRPGRRDLARGCTPKHRAYFFGKTVERPHATALPDEGARARGEIVIFRRNIAPVTRDRLELVVRHELSHAFGYDETEVQYDLGFVLPEDLACCSG